jgi:hypothetical protein
MITIIDVDPQTWIADLEHEDRNTAKSCQTCSIQEDIARISSPLASLSSPSSGSIAADTVWLLMVPTQDTQAYTADLQNKGFAIDSTYNFKDLRGGQSGTGDEQTLVVWTTSRIPDLI